ncbi:MAG: hypothetical protein AMXMBFR34_17760 [Myxococcaceae bacterium]
MSETLQIERTKSDWLSAGNAAVPAPTASLRTRTSADWLPAANAAVLSAVGTPASRATGTEDVQPNPAPAVVARLATSPYRVSSPTRFDLRQQWEGIVAAVSGDTFTATLKDLTDPAVTEESAELFLEDVGESDRNLVEPGAVFYWSVGYEDTPRGRERKSIIRFRRLPGWSRQQLNSVKEKTAELSKYFLGAESKALGR